VVISLAGTEILKNDLFNFNTKQFFAKRKALKTSRE
jgi:hypothetical protein